MEKSYQDLARIILVRNPAGRDIAVAVPEHIEVATHRRVKSDGFEERAIIRKGIIGQGIVVRRERPTRALSLRVPTDEVTIVWLMAKASRCRS